jgi:large subunit ribosomal protein L21
MSYAIISLGGKQYRVTEGEYLLVDRLPHGEGETFEPPVLMVGGDGGIQLGPEVAGTAVTARVDAHVKGPKIVVGKHRRRTGYRRRTGFRASLSKITIVSIGASAKPARSRKRAAKE